MIWNYFIYFAVISALFWCLSIALTASKANYAKYRTLSLSFTTAGLLINVAFIALLWIQLERPPLRTLGETRLWYAIFLPLCALLVELRWKFRWLKAYCLFMAILFLILELASPQNIDKTLPPALQSPWFIPHVIVYIVGYAFLGSAAFLGLHGWWQEIKAKNTDETAKIAHQMAIIGFIFINLGLIFGGFWAKEAWGHYWSWDPKETWAFLTWLVYLIYLHIFCKKSVCNRTIFSLLTVGFAVLLVCWFGISYLATSAQSVHTYPN